jgi:hypothetical protein
MVEEIDILINLNNLSKINQVYNIIFHVKDMCDEIMGRDSRKYCSRLLIVYGCLMFYNNNYFYIFTIEALHG